MEAEIVTKRQLGMDVEISGFTDYAWPDLTSIP